MRRLAVAFFAVLTVAGPGEAQTRRVFTNFGIGGGDQLRGQVEARAGPVFGGVRGATLADPERLGELALFVGLRPALRTARLTLELTDPVGDGRPRFDLDYDRPLGERASVSASLDLDGEAEEARTEAVAALKLTRRTRIRARVRGTVRPEDDRLSFGLTASRSVAPGSEIELGLAEGEGAATRASLKLALRF